MADPGELKTSKIEPAQLQAMQANPGRQFSVIVETGLSGKKPSKTANADRAKGAVDRLKANGAKSVKSLAIIGGGAGTLNLNGIAKLSRDPFVDLILLDRNKPLGTPGWASIYTQLVHAPDVWEMGFNGNGMTVAIVDSGIAPVDAHATVDGNVSGFGNLGLRPSNDFAKAGYPLLYGIPLSNLWRDPRYQGMNRSNITWDNITWDNITWDNMTWSNITWDNIT